MVARNATPVNSPGPAYKAETGAVCVRGGNTVTNLHRACAVLGVTHEEIAARAGCSRPLVTLCLLGHKRLSEGIKTAAVDLCRERLRPHVADLETIVAIVAAALQEQAGGDPQ